MCMDPICSHLNENCGAHTVQDEKSMLKGIRRMFMRRIRMGAEERESRIRWRNENAMPTGTD